MAKKPVKKVVKKSVKKVAKKSAKKAIKKAVKRVTVKELSKDQLLSILGQIVLIHFSDLQNITKEHNLSRKQSQEIMDYLTTDLEDKLINKIETELSALTYNFETFKLV